MTNKPFAESCERNQQPILQIIQPHLNTRNSCLEIGSGTGQHAVFFAEKFPHLTWQTSDRAENHGAINLWLADAKLSNVRTPVELDVLTSSWPSGPFESVFSANTSHIMPWEAVVAMFAGVGKILSSGGVFLLYGPFNYHGKYTSDSNARFDQWLKSQYEHQAIRDFEAVNDLAEQADMTLAEDNEMPANNRLIVWQKR